MLAYVGTRTTAHRKARGPGLVVCTFEPGSPWTKRHVYPMENPSYLAISRRHRKLFVAHGDHDLVSAFSIASDGALSPAWSQAYGGRNPVHLCVDPGGGALLVADHDAGLVTLVPIDRNGEQSADPRTVALPAPSGVSQPHQISFHPSGRFFVVPDKGQDQLLVFRIDNGGIEPLSSFPLPMGSGPRHIVFTDHGTQAYLVNELDSSVALLECDVQQAKIREIARWSSLPEGVTSRHNLAAAILIAEDGHHVVASNRGHDSLVCFRRDPQTGRLSEPRWIASGGPTPRFATMAAGRLFVANEHADSVCAFEQREGLVAVGRVLDIGSPVALAIAG